MKTMSIILLLLFTIVSGCENQKPEVHTTSYSEVINFLPLEIIENIKMEATDSTYYMPLNPMYFINAAPNYTIPIQFKEDKEYNDCDKRVRIFRGWMALNGYGQVLLMDAAVITDKNERHNLIAFIEPESPYRLRFIEPKEQKMISIEESNKYKILRLIL